MWYYGPASEIATLPLRFFEQLQQLAPSALPPTEEPLLVAVDHSPEQLWLEQLLLRQAWQGRLYVLHARRPDSALAHWLRPLADHGLPRKPEWWNKLTQAPIVQPDTRDALRRHVWQREWAKFTHDARKALHLPDPGRYIQQRLTAVLALAATPHTLQIDLDAWHHQLPELSLTAIDDALQRWSDTIDLPVQALRWRSIQRHWQALSPPGEPPLPDWETLSQQEHPEAAVHVPHLEHELQSLLPPDQWRWERIATQPVSVPIYSEGDPLRLQPLRVMIMEENAHWRATLQEAVELVAEEYRSEVDIAIPTSLEEAKKILNPLKKRSKLEMTKSELPPDLVIVGLSAQSSSYHSFLKTWILPQEKRGKPQFPLVLMAPAQPHWEMFRTLYPQGLDPQDVVLKTGINYLVQRLRVWLGQLGRNARSLQLVLDVHLKTITLNGYIFDWSSQHKKCGLLASLIAHPEGISARELADEINSDEQQISDSMYQLGSRLIADAKRWGIYLHSDRLIVRTSVVGEGARYRLAEHHNFQVIDSSLNAEVGDDENPSVKPTVADFCVWVVEDDPFWQEQVAALLADMGLYAVTLADLQTVATRLKIGPPPALICLDLAIPVQAGDIPVHNGGLTALAQIRAQYPHVAVVVMSTQSHSPQLMAEALRARISLHDIIAKGDASGQWLTLLYQRLWLHRRLYLRLAMLGSSEGLPRIVVRILDWQPQPQRLLLEVNGQSCGPYTGNQGHLIYLLLTAPEGGLYWIDAYAQIYEEEAEEGRQEKYEQLLKNVRKKIANWPVTWGDSSPQQVLLKWGEALCLQVQLLG